MFSKEDFKHIPSEYEMSNYINNELWNKFCKFIKSNYNINPRFRLKYVHEQIVISLSLLNQKEHFLYYIVPLMEDVIKEVDKKSDN